MKRHSKRSAAIKNLAGAETVTDVGYRAIHGTPPDLTAGSGYVLVPVKELREHGDDYYSETSGVWIPYDSPWAAPWHSIGSEIEPNHAPVRRKLTWTAASKAGRKWKCGHRREAFDTQCPVCKHFSRIVTD